MHIFLKHKIVFIVCLLFCLAACHSTSHTGSMRTNKDRAGFTQKVEVIRANNLQLNSRNSTDDHNTNNKVDLSSKAPVYIISSVDKFSLPYSQVLCNSMNNDFTNNKYLCIAHGQPDTQTLYQLLRYDDLTINPQALFVADFLITRTDHLIEKQQNNTGPLRDLPTLDAVMFLNGSYLFLWGKGPYRDIELSSFISSMQEYTYVDTIKIVVVNQLAKDLITKVILANKWSVDFELIEFTDLKSYQSYNILAYAGPDIIQEVQDHVLSSRDPLIPLTLSDTIIDNVKKANIALTSAEVTAYFPTYDLINVMKVQEQQNQHNTNNSLDGTEPVPVDTHAASGPLPKIPFVPNQNRGNIYDREVFGKSKFNFNVQPVEEILKPDTIMNLDSVRINTIGIRDVLVATRATEPLLVTYMLNTFGGQFDLIKTTFPTPDMRQATLYDLITGNLTHNNLIYHAGVINFNNNITNNGANKLWEKEAAISTVISQHLTDTNAAPFYGLSLPNEQIREQIQIKEQNRVVNQERKNAIFDLKNILDNIKEELVELNATNH